MTSQMPGAPICLAHTQLDYARLLLDSPAQERRRRRAHELIGAAAGTAAELGLPAVTARASQSRQI